MVVDDTLFFILASNRKSLVAMAKLFQLTEAELNHPDCGEWIVDQIKQLQTVNLGLKSLQMRRNPIQNVENYHQNPLENKTNPLLTPETPGTE